jgi:hypothetical protein
MEDKMTPERIAAIAAKCKFSEYYDEGKFVDYASVTPKELEAFTHQVLVYVWAELIRVAEWDAADCVRAMMAMK